MNDNEHNSGPWRIIEICTIKDIPLSPIPSPKRKENREGDTLRYYKAVKYMKQMALEADTRV